MQDTLTRLYDAYAARLDAARTALDEAAAADDARGVTLDI